MSAKANVLSTCFTFFFTCFHLFFTKVARGNGVARHYCVLYDGATQVDDSKVSFSCKSYSHVDAQDDASEKLFVAEEWTRNIHQPMSANYAILDQLENFRNQDGSFLFKLVYPRAEKEYTRDDSTDAFIPVEIIWSQRNNPVTTDVGVPVSRYMEYSNRGDNAGCLGDF